MKMANRTSLPFSRGLNIQWWELSGRSAEVSIMFSPRVLKFPPIHTLYSNKYDSKGETDFSVQLILHKRTLLEVFVKIIWILDFGDICWRHLHGTGWLKCYITLF